MKDVHEALVCFSMHDANLHFGVLTLSALLVVSFVDVCRIHRMLVRDGVRMHRLFYLFPANFCSFLYC